MKKKEIIFKNAIKLFEKYWPNKVSIDMIVQKSKVWKGTFYKYFENKEFLYKIILEQKIKNLENEELQKIFLEFSKKEKLVNILFFSFIKIKDDNILKNIFLNQNDFYFWEVDFDYLKKNHTFSLKKIIFSELWEQKFDLFIDLIYFYLKWILSKTENYKKDEIFDYSYFFANIFVNGFLQTDNDILKLNPKIKKFIY